MVNSTEGTVRNYSIETIAEQVANAVSSLKTSVFIYVPRELIPFSSFLWSKGFQTIFNGYLYFHLREEK